MRASNFRLPVASLGHFAECLRKHNVAIAIRLPDWPGEFECDLRHGSSVVSTHGYRLGDELRFDFAGSGAFSDTIIDCILACGGSLCHHDDWLDGWEAIQPPDTPPRNNRTA